MKYDIIIATVPKTYFEAPLLSPSLLKSILKEKGYSCKVLDWNVDFYKRTKGSELFDKAKFLSNNDSIFTNFSSFDEMWNMGLKELVDDWVDELLEYNPEWFGLTIFTDANFHISCKMLEVIRKKAPHIKIVAGSDGVASTLKKPTVGAYLKSKNLIDHYIIGEAENALYELLKGNLDYSGINGNDFDRTVDISQQPLPDYSDLNMKDYNALWVMGSRGCVNKCAFCESNLYFRGYRVRDPQNIVDEILYLKETYGIKKYNFADNVINGNLKHLRELCKLLKGKGVKWYGQTICNPRMKKEDFKLLGESGLFHLCVGVESGCERVRREMGKRFTNEDLNRYLFSLKEHGISIRVSLIVGWFTETEEDFQETLDFLSYAAKHKIVDKVSLGGTLSTGRAHRSIAPWVPMYKDYNHLLEWDEKDNYIYKENTMQVRIKRWKRLKEHCLKHGFITHEIKYAKMNHLHRQYFGEDLE